MRYLLCGLAALACVLVCQNQASAQLFARRYAVQTTECAAPCPTPCATAQPATVVTGTAPAVVVQPGTPVAPTTVRTRRFMNRPLFARSGRLFGRRAAVVSAEPAPMPMVAPMPTPMPAPMPVTSAVQPASGTAPIVSSPTPACCNGASVSQTVPAVAAAPATETRTGLFRGRFMTRFRQ